MHARVLVYVLVRVCVCMCTCVCVGACGCESVSAYLRKLSYAKPLRTLREGGDIVHLILLPLYKNYCTLHMKKKANPWFFSMTQHKPLKEPAGVHLTTTTPYSRTRERCFLQRLDDNRCVGEITWDTTGDIYLLFLDDACVSSAE